MIRPTKFKNAFGLVSACLVKYDTPPAFSKASRIITRSSDGMRLRVPGDRPPVFTPLPGKYVVDVRAIRPPRINSIH
jgi:hypothetical protein